MMIDAEPAVEVASPTALVAELANHPGAMLAWEVDCPDELCLSMFHVEGGTQQLAWIVVTQDLRASIAAELATLGHVQGAYASMTGFVWCSHDGAFTVWGAKGRVFHSDGQTLDFAGQSVPFDPAMQVIAFMDDDYGRRGVRIASGAEERAVATHLQLRASVDWSYGWPDALMDSGWTIHLGRALANFLGVELIDETGGPDLDVG